MSINSPYHEGELLMQQRVGQLKEAQQNGRIICSTIPKGALKFIEQQPMVVFGSVDDQQNVWASALFGRPGFIMAVDQRTVELDLTQTACNWQDPFWTNIKCCSQVGILVIEFATRRRLRINGRITYIAQERLRLDVAESYPNCPKYIQRRNITYIGNTLSRSSSLREGQLLEPDQQSFIASVDTFFVASVHPTRGVDASHRGGNAGFIRILDDKTIRIPDYAGNSMFNTLGNLMVNPRAGFIFLDFERNYTLQLIGQAEILWELNDPMHKTGDTKRYWNLKIERWLEINLPQLFHCEFLDYSPHNPS